VLAVMKALDSLPLRRGEWRWQIPVYAIGSVAAFWTLQRLSAF